MSALDGYVELTKMMLKRRAEGASEAEEDGMLDQLDVLWWMMTNEEQDEATERLKDVPG